MSSGYAFYGTIIHAESKTRPMSISQNALLVVKENKIVEFLKDLSECDAKKICEQQGINSDQLEILNKYDFLMPGFVDAHIHAPQYTFIGVGYDMLLLDWLNTYTFPIESKFADIDFARNVYEKVVRRTLQHGTTTASYFATIHKEASLVLADVMDRMGQRGYVGKVCMDTNSPDHYVETTQQSLDETRSFVQQINEKYSKKGLVKPCITPRFALSCSMPLMTGLGKIAKEFDLPVQTHMSENCQEVEQVLERFGVQEYIQVYEKAGLVTEKSIFAHCVHSNGVELDILKQHNSGIAHCPNSNISIRSGAMNIRFVEEHGVKIGLGTDVSGGYSTSIQDSMRKAVETSKLLSMIGKCRDNTKTQYIGIADAFYLATLGGAEVMGLQDTIGNFVVGKDFDALVIKPTCSNSPFDIFDFNSVEDVIQKFFFAGDDRNICDIYVAGKKVQI